jgi:hypothetical protein
MVFCADVQVPIPSYLLAIAVGDLEERRIGPLSRVWSEPSVVDAAAYEFQNTHRYLQTGLRSRRWLGETHPYLQELRAGYLQVASCPCQHILLPTACQLHYCWLQLSSWRETMCGESTTCWCCHPAFRMEVLQQLCCFADIIAWL